MRLKKVEKGRGLKSKLIFAVMRIKRGVRAPDVVRTLFYRAEYFGTPFGDYLQQSLRTHSEWSVGERELFAAFTSRKNQCLF